jgi:hypothetical protein
LRIPVAQEKGMAGDNGFSDHEFSILRRLAARVAELAARPLEAAKRDLWRRHNRLEPTRPLIVCDPENGWHEIITPETLECQDPLAREWEWQLRKLIYTAEHLREDTPIPDYFEVHYVHSDTGWGVPIERHGGGHGRSYTWTPPLRDWSDMARLAVPQITVDHTETNRRLELANKAFGDLLRVRVRGFWWWSLGMTELLVYLRGMEQVMVDMIESPDELHRLMAFLRDAHMAKLDFLEANGLLTTNLDAYVGSGGYGFTDELPAEDYAGGPLRARDIWGFAESQETTSVSPRMFEEFIYPYQRPLLERFGLNCYGCCEPLHLRWHIVKQFPRLRRVSVSPWADLEKMAEFLGDRYVYSMKPNPSPIAVPEIDQAAIRQGLRHALEVTRGCRVEVILKDTHTIGRNPLNVVNWSRIAMEEAERCA